MKNVACAVAVDRVAEVVTHYCQHCGATIPVDRHDGFCCSGCSAVYRFLHGAHLQDYYRIRKESGTFRDPAPVVSLSEKTHQKKPFAYLDDPMFQRDLGIQAAAPAISFFLEGVHCTACLWLIEKLPEMMPGHVLVARLDLQSSTLHLLFKPGASIASVAEYLDQLGYRPHPVSQSQDYRELNKKESRTMLSRLAVAGAMAGNIMIFAIAIYAGAKGWVKDHFDWIIFALAQPVFFYSAVPLYQNALRSIRNQRWSVDIPIVIALIAGWVVSAVSVFSGGNQNYLDSLTGLVFLLLASRYFLFRLQKNSFDGLRFSEAFYPFKVIRNRADLVWVHELAVGDEVEVPSGMRIPVDGQITEGEGQIDESIVSGEAFPRSVKVHESVFAGTVNTGPTIWVRVMAVGKDTRIDRIATEIQNFKISDHATVRIAEAVAKYFTLSVLLWSAIVFTYFVAFINAPVMGLERVLSILIVSCPCAFAIATPLALIHAYQILIRRGLYLKNMDCLEEVLQVKNVAFDKTGTLTAPLLDVIEARWNHACSGADQIRFLKVIRGLESRSSHPIAKAMLRYVDTQSSIPEALNVDEILSDVEEIPGKGVIGKWNQVTVELTRPEQKSDSLRTLFKVNGDSVAEFLLKEQLKPEAAQSIRKLKDLTKKVWMITGDKYDSAVSVATKAGLEPASLIAECTPEEKASWIGKHAGTLYVGDGANDSLALKQATIGIAAHGALELSMKAADGYLIKNDLRAVADLIVVGAETRKILNRHLVFTIIYNGATITLATLGLLTPLFAAVLMPLSSFVILLSTKLGTKALRGLQ